MTPKECKMCGSCRLCGVAEHPGGLPADQVKEALLHRWMCGKEVGDRMHRVQRLHDEHAVERPIYLERDATRSQVKFFQRRSEIHRVPGEAGALGVGIELARTTDGRLDQPG